MHKVVLWEFFPSSNVSFCSNYGLTKHKKTCTKPAVDASFKTPVFTCEVCHRTFTQRRYLTQHKGGKKCDKRREVLERTSSFTLALTESPSSTRNLSLNSDEACI